MQNQSMRQALQISTNVRSRGLTLVLLASTWIAGILLASYILCSPIILLAGTVTSLLFAFILRRNTYGRLFMLLLLCFFCGAYRYTLARPDTDPQSISAFIGPATLSIRGIVSDQPEVRGHSRTFFVDVNAISRDSGNRWQPAHGQMFVRTSGTTVDDIYGANYGDFVELTGKLDPPNPGASPTTFASIAFPRIQVETNVGNPFLDWLYNLRVTFATIIDRALPQSAAALFIAVLLGMHTPALTPLVSAFNITGTAHLIAPSGFKVTILAGIVSQSIRGLTPKRGRRALPNEQRWQGWGSTFITILCIACYTVLSGAVAAAIRAGIMGALLVLAPQIRRNYNVYTALALSALLMSLLDPFVLWDGGFQLSFLGTLGIVLLTPYLQHLLHPLTRLPGGHFLQEVIAVTLAAQLATWPINALVFQEISFIAPLANMLTVPLLEILLIIGMLLCISGVLFFPCALVIGWVAWPILWYVNQSILWCASLPAAHLHITTFTSSLSWLYYILLALPIIVLLKKRPHSTLHLPHHKHTRKMQKMLRLAQAGIAILIIFLTALSAHTSRYDTPFTITFLNVGPINHAPEGEAILLRTSDGKTALIDGGLDATSLGQQLDARLPSWQRSLDTLILTSPRADHIDGLLDILSRYSVNSVFDAGMLHPSTTYARWRRTISKRNVAYHTVVQGYTIPLGNAVSLQVLWPTTHLHTGSNETRDNGLVLRLQAPGLTLLLVGATAQSTYALEGLLSLSPISLLHANIVQIMGDPGKTSSDKLALLLQRAHPSLLIVTPAQVRTQHKNTKPSSGSQFLAYTIPIQMKVLQTQQIGTLEVSSTLAGWHISNTH